MNILARWRQRRREKRAMAIGRAFVAAARGVAPETLSDEEVLTAFADAFLTIQAAMPTFEEAAAGVALFAQAAREAWEDREEE